MTDRKTWAINTQLIHPQEVKIWPGNNPIFAPVYQSIYTVYPGNLAWWHAPNDSTAYYLDRRNLKNPNVKQLEIMLAQAQHRESCLVFTSGMAAISSVFFSLVQQPNETVIFFKENHSLSKRCLHTLQGFGIPIDEVSFYPHGDYIAQMEAIIQKRTSEGKRVKLIHFETVLSPLLRIVDVAALVQLAKKHQILTSLDGSLGGIHYYKSYDQVDLVCHALSKIANGHGDLLGGAVAGKKELIEEIYFKGQLLLGCEMDPYRAVLLASHLKTYALRYDRQQDSAHKIADFLLKYDKKSKNEERKIKAVHYPGLATHPDKDLISRQMHGSMGDVIIMELAPHVAENADTFCRRLKIFQMAWGSGYCESLAISMDRFMEHGHTKQPMGMHSCVIRLAIGLEDPADLMEDLSQALEGSSAPMDAATWQLNTQLIHPFDPRAYPSYYTNYKPVFPPIQYATLSVPSPHLDFFDKAQFLYTRAKHITNTDLEQRLAEVQRREACLVYASKIAAITSTFFSLLKKGDCVIVFQESARKTKRSLEHFRDHFGIKLAIISLQVDYLKEIKSKLQKENNVRLIHFESLYQPMLRLIAIDKMVALAHAHGIYTTMDGTYSGIHQYTGNSCKVDLIFHDLSKIPNGHGNAGGGSVTGKKELIEQIYAKGRHACGASMDPTTTALIMHNLQSYMVRYQAHTQNAQKIASYLAKHPHIQTVRYLSQPNHPDAKLMAKHRQHMQETGELVTFEIKEAIHLNAGTFCRKLRLFQLALGSGSVTSMAFPIDIYYEQDLWSHSAPPYNDRWVRLSIGLEAVDDLINDLEQALVIE